MKLADEDDFLNTMNTRSYRREEDSVLLILGQSDERMK